jgi:hypothetical protein
MVEEGTAILRRGNEVYPTFVKFTEPLVYGDLPPTDPQFRVALESFREVFFLADDRPCEKASTDKACTNSPGAPHNREGFALYAGDFYARGQERDHALRWYMTARSIPSWDSWRYQSVVEERIRTLDERVAAALTPSLADDLPSVWSSETGCSFCHAK